MKKPELLAPAGNMAALEAAIMAGCDAIYLGGSHFGARAYSNNFNDEEIVEAIKYAHIYGVKIYVTVNTIIYEAEIKSFMEYIDYLHKNNVDAIIIQDLGMIDLIRKTYPNLEIHASTQMHIHNLEGVKLCEKLNMKRVVLARETSIDKIKEIKKNTNLELEIFIHGALCVCYSGECLMSSLIGGRSGNRGTCSQPCRMPYDLISDNKIINKDKYLISTKDLNTLDYIGDLIDIGVDSLKIEGRMKSKEYVYQVVSLYRMAIDSYMSTGKVTIDLEELKKLKTIFNRKYTKGFLFNEDNNNFINQYRPNHIGIEIGKVVEYKNNYASIELTDDLNRLDGIRILSKTDTGLTIQSMFVNNKKIDKAYKGDIVSIKINDAVYKNDIVVKTLDKELMNEIDLKINKKSRKVKINGVIECKLNKPVKLTVTDNKNEIILYSEEQVSESINKSVDGTIIYEKLNKLGNTPYIFDNLKIIADDNIFIRLNALNELKRQMVDILNQKRLYSTNYKLEKYNIDLKEYKEEKGYNVYIHKKEDYNLIKNNIKNIYLDKNLYNEIKDDRNILKLPRVINSYKEYNNELLVGELGSVNKYKNVVTDFSLNIVNSYAVALLHSLGVKRVTLSYELNDYQIEKLIDNYKKRYNLNPNLELIVSSLPEVMVTKFNLINYFNLKNNNNYLKDSFNNKFRIIDNKEFMTIYFYKKLELNDYKKYFDMGINTLRIHIEDKEDIKKLY